MLSKTPPSVSVILSVYNGGPTFRSHGIDSILKQTFTDFEFIIVDDASTDGSADVIRQAMQEDARIKGIFLSENVGIARARNAGLAMASGKYMMVQDATDISYPDRMEKQFSFMENNPDFIWVGGSIRVINLNIAADDNGSGTEQGKKNLTGDFLSGKRESFLRYATSLDQIGQATQSGKMPACHLAFFVRMTALRKIGGYHPALPVAEDVDLFLRLSPHGKMVNLPDVIADHIVDGDNSSNRVPLWKATCALAASRAHLARLKGKPDMLAGRETPPGLEVLETAESFEEYMMLLKFTMASLLWGFDREVYRNMFFDLLNKTLAMEMGIQAKCNFIFSFMGEIFNYTRQRHAEHYNLLQELYKKMMEVSGGQIAGLPELKDAIKKFLDGKNQDSSWLEY